MDSIAGKIDSTKSIIGLYFSGDYCKYCKEFTPILVENYTKLLNNNIDIVLVSSDKNKEKYDKYRATQPWQALPYEDADIRIRLRDQYNITTIPALLFFDANQQILLESDGRNMIRDNCDETIRYLNRLIIKNYDSEDSDF
jgi:nucleoredoxin